ncbi:MAG: CoB--CoM heterodisulfide reductase subunit C [Halobacteriota archaeon]
MASENMRNPKHEQLGVNQFDPDLIKEVEARGGKNARLCFQCGTCTAGCPMGQRSGLRVRTVMRKANLGMREVLDDPDLWLCTTCYTCADRCPRRIMATDAIIALRNIATQEKKVPMSMIKIMGMIYKTGHGVPNSEGNMKKRVQVGLPENPPTTHTYPEYIKDIQTILEVTGLLKIKEEMEAASQ